MESNNQYWGLPFVEIEELVWERVQLFKQAFGAGQFGTARIHETEMSLMMDALAAYERG